MHAGPPYKNPALAVSRAATERALRRLQQLGLLDPSRRVLAGDDTPDALIPVLADDRLPALARELDARLVDPADLPAREARATPLADVLSRLARLDLPEAVRAMVPDRWEKLGDVVVLRIPETLRPRFGKIAGAFAEVLRAKAVVRDTSGVSGELREMDGELLYGSDPVTTHLENGVRFRLDASRIMFSSGNFAERTRAASIRAAGETVVDMFAGIGYFTLPLAVHAKPARIHALEKNPLSFRYLQEGIALNGVGDVVQPWLGDNREFPLRGIADRVLMGYLPGTAAFLPHAFQLLKPAGGRIHYHDTAHERRWKEEMTTSFLDAARACGRVVAVEEARIVKSHSPGVVHAVLVARVAS